MPSAKKRKEDTAATPPSSEKGGGSTRTSPARSPSRGQGRHHREESAPVAPLAPEVPAPVSADEVLEALEPLISHAQVTTSPPPSAALLAPSPSASSIALERFLSDMARLREDLLGADPRLAAASSEKEKQSAIKVAADRDAALKDAEAACGRCQELEDELKRLRDQHAEEARDRQVKEEEMRAWEDAIKNRDTDLEELEKAQAAERSRLEELEREAKAKEADLDAKTKVLAEDRAAFVDLEESCVDPSARLDELLEPVADEHCTAAAAAMQGQVEALLKKFCGFDSAPSTGGDTTMGGVPPAGIDGAQG
nr:tol-Pal system protein TolA-like [Aegilops tauschii subsp. strangulata]